MQIKMFHKVGGRQTRAYQGDPIGTAEKIVDWLIEQVPVVTVQKLPEPYTNDGLVLEICGQVIYQFITPGGSLRISGLPDCVAGFTWPCLMLKIIRQYDCEIKPVYASPKNRYLIFRLDCNSCQLNDNPVIPWRLYRS